MTLPPAKHRRASARGLPVTSYTEIDAYIERQMKGARIPGLALGIVHDGRPVHLRGFGRADESGRAFTPQTPFFIGSNSKSFTALAVMQLAEAGKLGLDEPVRRYIPWFRVADPDASALITVRQLLNQTSGLTDRAGRGATLAKGMQPLELAVRALATTRLTRLPGEAFEYSNLNYTTLGLVVEMAAGEPFDAYLKTHIFAPLNMRHTYTAIVDARRDGLACGYRYWFGVPVAFDTPGHGSTVPTGGIISTAEDMSRYLAMYQGAGSYHGQVLLSPAGIAEMMQPGPPERRGVFAGAGYGMGWFTGPWGGVDASYHFGDEPNAHAGMALVPQGNWGVVVLFNVGTHGGALPGLLAIEQSVTGMVAGGTVRDTGVAAFYVGFDAAVAAALAVDGWSLARLARRKGVVAQDRRWPLPLLWEFGIPAAVAVVPTAVFKVNWKGLLLYGPDMSCALAGIGGLSALTGVFRVMKALHSARSRPATH
ncbi:MAG TPA: serine hydrolase domain-containing protein [Solirubrobacteraceae bacterium]|nr:serine hydrolase domain-containing protein [Solirubrobacteraceae bacterium]